jgi:hypothetical protein
MKPPPMTKGELTYGNNFVPLFLNMPVCDDLETALKASKHNIRGHIGSNKMKGMDRMIWSLNNLPFNQGRRVLNYMTQQNSVRLSSAPGPRHPVTYAGYKMDALCCIMPRTSWTFSPAINFASIGDNLSVSFITYTNCIKHPDEFV